MTDSPGFSSEGVLRPYRFEPAAALPGRPRSRTRAQKQKRCFALALQGGGSFGAFTWGVLDRLLEEGGIAYDAVSGSSAGAVNAILLASGLAEGGPEAARERLERFWRRASEAAPRARPGLAVALATRVLSPYQFNPFNLHPLRTILSEEIDFEALRDKSRLKLLVAATRVRDGRLRIFRERSVDLDVVLASTCLPMLHHSVSIDGEAYWDGGYAANPPVFPLISATRAREAIVVQIMPSTGAEDTPTTPAEIARRMEQITFNTPLLRDMEALAAMTKLAASDEAGSRLSRKLRKLRVHHIAAEDAYPDLRFASALDLDWDFLTGLREAGRRAAERFLAQAPTA
jgi:NTE family protein